MTTAVARRVICCDECRTPVAEVREQGIVLRIRHHNALHITIVPWEQVRVWLAERERVDDTRAVA